MFALPKGCGREGMWRGGRKVLSGAGLIWLTVHIIGDLATLNGNCWQPRVALYDNQLSPRRVNKAPCGNSSSQKCLLISRAKVAKIDAQKCFIINSHSAKDLYASCLPAFIIIFAQFNKPKLLNSDFGLVKGTGTANSEFCLWLVAEWSMEGSSVAWLLADLFINAKHLCHIN